MYVGTVKNYTGTFQVYWEVPVFFIIKGNDLIMLGDI